MNQTQSRRLRMRCLMLLLTPLLVASTPSPLPATRGMVLAAAPTRLVFLPFPPEITKGQCVPVTVEARDGSGAPASPGSPVTLKLGSSLAGGAFFASNTCQQPGISSVVLPGSSTRVQTWFKASGLGSLLLTASDGLLGMIDAVAVPVVPVPVPTARLEFQDPPSAVTAGQSVNITVVAFDTHGFPATEYSGTIRFTSTDRGAVLPPDYTFNPSVDSGRKTFSVTFGTPGTANLVAEDVSNSSLQASAPNIAVRGGAATRLEIANLPSQAFLGTPLSFQVLALDENGSPGTLRGNLVFSSNASASLPPEGPPRPSYTVTFNSIGPATLSVTDSTGGAESTTVAIEIVEAPFRSVAVTPSFTQKRTCERAKLTLAVTDSQGPMSVSLCREDGHAAIPVTVTNFTDWVMTDQCVTGTFTDSAEVEWVSKQRDDVPFKIYGATASSLVRVSWRPEPNPALTSFDFLTTSEDIPRLPVGDEHSLELRLSDTCPDPKPLALPSGVITFEASDGLFPSTSSNTATPGRWVVSVRLPNCPADATQPLAIWPKLNGTALTKPDGGRIERLVQPKCPPIVEMVIISQGDDRKVVEPGGLVEFEVELTNQGQEPVMNGLLMVSAEKLTVLEARLAGEPEPLTPHDEGFIIPELLPGTKVRVKIKAQATTNPGQQLNAKVWYLDANGIALAPPQDVGLNTTGLGVDVGCGCHAASLPGELLPWLALLLAASRPWDRSRRMRRGERIDR